MSSASIPTTPTTMTAIVVKEHGDVNVLSQERDHPVPALKEGHVLVKNQYAGLNFIDTYYRSGLYQQPLPFIAGGEGGGTIVAISDDVIRTESDLQVGDHVVYMTLGTYCEYTLVPADKVVKLPGDMDMTLALACMIQGLTAHYLTTDATAGLIQPGDWCLIYSVGSGTCQWAAQMAKLQGYKVIGTTSQTKQDSVPSSVDELIVLETVEGKTYSDFESVDIAQRVMEITGGQGVKLIIDGVGKSTSEISIQSLARRGIWISFGNASGAVPPISLLRLTPKSAFVTRPKLNDYTTTREELTQRAEQVFGWIQKGDLEVKVDRIFPLQEAQQGHTYLENGQSKGKVLFRI